MEESSGSSRADAHIAVWLSHYSLRVSAYKRNCFPKTVNGMWRPFRLLLAASSPIHTP